MRGHRAATSLTEQTVIKRHQFACLVFRDSVAMLLQNGGKFGIEQIGAFARKPSHGRLLAIPDPIETGRKTFMWSTQHC